ncbi:VOC family protein [Bacillus sp. PK3_68]|uniref:VOC family protein n=1 Tax=Bacillus sp. PK3_68 TaxID=2027408 RepID=UPI000E707BE1|nr:VOC family protein [Bacillus sp. PK3_68]RJS50285.1 bleomycin resistance protein [Bacillus sp. PK3_68]
MELTHTRLLVDNYKECFLFYRDILGFEVSWGDEETLYADFKFSGCTLGLFERKQMLKAIGAESVSYIHKSDRIALIFKVDNVEEKYKELKEKVEFITKPTAQEGWGIKVAHFRDPDGSLIEIYESIG